MAELLKFTDKQAMAAELAGVIASDLRDSLNTRGAASLVVSGGSTPKLLFQQLSGQALRWENVVVTLADERWVDAGSADSNEYLVRNTLLIDAAADAKFIPLKTADASPEDALAGLETALAVLPTPLDTVLLGMGDDGHTASLFPHASALSDALDMNSGRQCMALTPKQLPAHAPYPRITLTLPKLLDSRRIILLLSGDAKLDVYQQALDGTDTNEMPVRAVLHQTQTPVVTYWAP